MKKVKASGFSMRVGFVFGLFLLGITTVYFFLNDHSVESISKVDFNQDTKVTEEETIIGTNITLYQEIHGTQGITYRYQLKTDCPYWKYEDRYVTDKPLSWVGKHAAVETKATAITVSYHDTIYAQGQFFEIPLLQLSKEDKSKAGYIRDLQAEAYASYKAEQLKEGDVSFGEKAILIIAILLAIGAVLILIKVSKKPIRSIATDSEKTKTVTSDTIQTEVPHAEQNNDHRN